MSLKGTKNTFSHKITVIIIDYSNALNFSAQQLETVEWDIKHEINQSNKQCERPH